MIGERGSSAGRLALFLGAAWLALLIGAELFSWLTLKVLYHRRPSVMPEIPVYLSRFHPLWHDNSDLNPEGVDYDELVGYRFWPGTVHFRQEPSYPSAIAVDAAGYVHNGDPGQNARLFALPSEKVYRVVLLGSSTTVGRGASDNRRTIAAELERLLQARWPKVPFHVLNAGVLGYTTSQERLLYAFYIKPMKPDLLIFLDGDNDSFVAGSSPEWKVSNNPVVFSRESYRRLHTPAGAFRFWMKRLIEFPQPFYSVFLARKALEKMGGKLGAPHLGGRYRKVAPFVFRPEAVERLEDNLRSIACEAAHAGSRAFFLLQPILSSHKRTLSPIEKMLLDKERAEYPGYDDANERYWAAFEVAYGRLAGDFKGEPRLRFVDLSGFFDETPDHIYESGWHYGNEGNRRLAEKYFHLIEGSVKQDLARRKLD